MMWSAPLPRVANVVKWPIAEELIPAPTHLEELEKEDQLALASDECMIIPLGRKTSAWGVERPSSGRGAGRLLESPSG